MSFKKILMILAIVMFCAGQLQADVGDVIRSFQTPDDFPTGLTYDGKYLWNTDRKTDMLYKIDPKSGEILSTLPSPGYQPEDLAYDGKYIWCLDKEENMIHQLDPKTGINVKTIWAPCERPRGMTFDGKHLWLSDIRGDELLQISTEDGTTIESHKAPSGNVHGLTFDGKYLWASDRIANKIYLIEPETGYVIFYFESPGEFPRGLAFDGKNLWNCDYQSDSIYSIKIKDDNLYKTWDEKHQVLHYTEQVRNYGPGEILDLEVYMAVPHQRDNQKIVGEIQYNPQPTEFRNDQWGQKVAVWHYDTLKAGQTVEPTMSTECKLYFITYFVYPEDVGTLEDIPTEIKEKYLVNDTKFGMDDDFMQKTVNQAVGDETNPYWIARNIYQHIMDNMFYELAGGWNIAPTVLKRGSGSCSEYSFVFISLCRAAGIPARYVGSVAVRGDDASTDDVFHRWCEIYLPDIGWFPVDPSGGDQEWPSRQAAYFGTLQNRFLITTEGGGGSEYLEWGYNSNEKWKSKGKVKIHTEHFGEWSPAPETSKSASK
ncbi:MAG: transglutaminase [candidate division Zixibacteria bacterium]|nr:transglutaminase [candidate division Zixibacteria bacterium]